MAATKVNSKKQAPRSRDKRTATSRSRPASQRQKTSKPQSEMPAQTGQFVPVEVVPLEAVEKRMQEAATQAVSAKTAAMVRKLAEKAASGNATSIRALLELMRGKNQSRSKAGSGSLKSLLGPVLDCTNEAEWQEFDKPNSEPAADGR